MPHTPQENKSIANAVAGAIDNTLGSAVQAAADMLKGSLELSQSMAAQNMAVALRHAGILEQALAQTASKLQEPKK